MMHPTRLIVLLAGFAVYAAMPAAADDTVVSAPARTLKERLTDKASDEQRVNDCKVPPEKRTRARPIDCASP